MTLLQEAYDHPEVSELNTFQTDEDAKVFTCGALFAGIGGFCYGFEKAGFKTSWCNDISPDSALTYQANFKSSRYICADITQLNANQGLDPVDVLHAGFPCQSFSAAGHRLGFADSRGKLFFEIIRLLKEWGDHRPKVLVLENSPHLRDGEGGAWFRTVQTEIQRSGYWFSNSNTFLIDTRDNGGLPQRRKRLFMVAVSQDYSDFNPINLSNLNAPEPLDLKELIKFGEEDEYYYLHDENKYFHMIKKIVDDDDPYQLYQLRKYFVRVPEKGVCPTLTANMGLGGHNVPFIREGSRMRKLTEWECLALQGFPSEFQFPEGMTKSKRYQQIGNSVSPIISELIAHTIMKFLRGTFK